ncbi:FAD-dependent monooxygenase [Pseudenhygromyxa sp. WMMC2535]|uniref:NAD(P)/FAD-dependent oxidoreductase n=1 Tax=Pseudenhygromyxa sp. WMMC2535 TaxID=2712867 RepID=UPI0015550542|nr:FAD-dependent monooxygenase [Pseudenhygromyxa sp. WMMC2535]NVB42808.1 FAD-dependent monooxygenase [Pseudenhygromyxa sp. WMMC2535]
MNEDHFDVIVVGGRPAGASLAARVAAAGLRVLVLDKSSFPSRPAVSAPFVLPHALALLDELGVDEEVYAAETPRLDRFVLEFGDYFRSPLRFFEALAGRAYFYAIDRARLDGCLWRNLERFESVRAIEGAKVEGILRDDAGRVTGVCARIPGVQELQYFYGDCVVGADGRNSLVAREVGALVTESRTDVDTTLYYAHWEGVRGLGSDGACAPSAVIHSSLDGFSFVFMPSAAGQTMVTAQGRADFYAKHLADSENPEAAYLALLRARPRLWARLSEAKQVSSLSGIKPFANLFRQATGPGWALVGDAFHQKDSIDAQGIYDALLAAKLLAGALISAHAGERRLDDALEGYAKAAHAKLRPMFEVTTGRLEREIYQSPPPLIAKTVMRWLLTNEDYGRRYADFLTRRVDPLNAFPPPLMLRCVATGALARVRAMLRRGTDPSDPLPLDVLRS